ncbi:glycosyltransferase [Niveibacterium sp. 24ML]|uniref:glycosyltransferase family 2 protein n=1 Tax=Niveibacterium sp. 24ML TaxID=2985512 RepID=UPI00226E294E|nr:glycosyltransferase family 2 protein [Niveibacterium sp. 24ML]MCX9156662.1 glycosyltransferase [Niveibacterium sp. 24ML]
MKSDPSVTIVVLNWNGWQDTAACVRSLFNLKYERFNVVVCDNGSTDGSLDELLNAFSADHLNLVILKDPAMNPVSSPFQERLITLIDNRSNLGFAGGNNVGMRYAMQAWDPDFYWVLNNDTEVDPLALRELLDEFRRMPGVGICGSKLVYWHGRSEVQALGGGIHNRVFCTTRELKPGAKDIVSSDMSGRGPELDYVSGASMLVSRRLVEDVGLMEERYFLYFEELDWAERARKKGFQLGYADSSVVYHKEGATIGTNARTPKARSVVSEFYGVRSRILFTSRFYPLFLPTLYLALLVAVIRRFQRSQPDRAKMILGLMLRPTRRL